MASNCPCNNCSREGDYDKCSGQSGCPAYTNWEQAMAISKGGKK